MTKTPLRAIDSFLFAESSPRPMAILRIVLGLYLVPYYLIAYETIHENYKLLRPGAAAASLPPLTLFNIGDLSPTAFHISYCLMILAALFLGLGLFTRTAAIGLWSLNSAIKTVSTFGLNGGDQVVNVVIFLIAIAALAGHAQRMYSLDRWFGSDRDLPTAPPWSIRLLQFQLVAIYFFTGFHKIVSLDWYRGEAMFYVMQQKFWSRVEWGALGTNPAFVGLTTYGTLLFEILLFPVLVWPRSTRLFVLAGGVAFHVGIALTMRIFTFGEIMPICYLAFLEERHYAALTNWYRYLKPRFQDMRNSSAMPTAVGQPDMAGPSPIDVAAMSSENIVTPTFTIDADHASSRYAG